MSCFEYGEKYVERKLSIKWVMRWDCVDYNIDTKYLTKRFEGITLEEYWFGVTPNLSYLKVFGSIDTRTQTHTHAHKRTHRHANAYTRTHACTHTNAHVHPRAHAHTCTYTHIFSKLHLLSKYILKSIWIGSKYFKLKYNKLWTLYNQLYSKTRSIIDCDNCLVDFETIFY